jgi:hypothetical protein
MSVITILLLGVQRGRADQRRQPAHQRAPVSKTVQIRYRYVVRVIVVIATGISRNCEKNFTLVVNLRTLLHFLHRYECFRGAIVGGAGEIWATLFMLS